MKQEKHKPQKKSKNDYKDYSHFEKIDGHHPWKQDVPEGFIDYPVRVLKKGQVTYFNFNLAKEMGLIHKDHPHQMNKALEEVLKNTFNLRIINEYDQENKISYEKKSIKPNQYMATKYLQLQHKNKQGKTSGDGRGIWNGIVKHKGTSWDISTRGTGVTQLAPGSVEAEGNLKSGDTQYGYGCGLSEMDELYSASILSEIFHFKNINTERVLLIIDHSSDIGLCVRAGKNLFRPAHIFSFLKQGNYDALSRATNFLIDRQFQNKSWNFSSKTPHKYSKLTEELCYSFAEFTAQLEREYIFTWLEWDGDNVLSDAGIIDYGSIRQFGLRHDHYKYDDVERFSTNLSGQRNKAKKIIQTFIQLTDFLKSKQKKPLSDFENSKILKNFDEAYDYFLVSKFLKQVGLEDKYINVLMRKYRKDMNTFYQSFLTLEKQKSSEPLKKVEDGVNRTPLFNMRRTLIDIPESILNNKLDLETILYNTVTELAPESDKKHSEKFINNFQIFYKMYDSTLKTVTKEFNNHSRTKIIKSIVNNSKIHNAQNRLTGNALISIVNELIHAKKKGLPHSELQKIIDHLIVSQVSVEHKRSSKPRHKKSKKLMNTILTLIDGFKEDI